MSINIQKINFQILEPKLKELDTAAMAAAKIFDQPGDFLQEIKIAESVATLREMLTPELMQPIMALMNTDLGFRTDRDPKTNDKETNQPMRPYPVEVVREVFIEARLRGFHLIGNEFNIIAGRFYACQQGFRRKVKELTNGTFEPNMGIPIWSQTEPGKVRIKCSAKWIFNGQPGDIGLRPEDQCEIVVRVNKYMADDGALGKAYRKLLRMVHDRLSGRETPDGDVTDIQTVAALPGPSSEPGGGNKTDTTFIDPAKQPIELVPGVTGQPVKAPEPGPQSMPAGVKRGELFENLSETEKEFKGHCDRLGITFDRVTVWLEQNRYMANATSYSTWDELPDAPLRGILVSKRTMNLLEKELAVKATPAAAAEKTDQKSEAPK